MSSALRARLPHPVVDADGHWIETAPVLKRAAEAMGVDMPIVAAVCALLAGEASVDEVVEALLSRPLRAEGL